MSRWPEGTDWYNEILNRLGVLESEQRADRATLNQHQQRLAKRENEAEAHTRWHQDMNRTILGLEQRDEQLSDRITALEQLTEPEPEPLRDISRWVDEFMMLEEVNSDKWDTLCDSYSHDARHIIGAYCDLAEAGEPEKNNTLGMALRFIAAYDRYPRNRNDDLVKNMVLPRVYALTGDERIKDHCKRVLDDVRDLQVGSPGGSQPYRQFSYLQNSYPFSFSGPWGRWQGQGTAVWLLASVVDKGWANNMRMSWDYEMGQSPGVWGATWNPGEGQYRDARNTFKAGRECYLIDAGMDRGTFLDAWDRVRGAFQITPSTVHQYIDGTTVGDPQRGATQLYDGWVRLGQWSWDMRDVVDYTLEQTSGPWHNLNDTDPARVRRAALLAGRARVEVLR